MDMESLLSENGVTYKRGGENINVRQDWIGIDCPFCGKGEKKFFMGYSLEGKFFTCWRCGSHSVFDVLREITGKSNREISSLIKRLPRARVLQTERREGTLWIPPEARGMKKAHRRYLHARGFSPRKIERLWRVKGISEKGRLAWRLWIPIYYRGEVVSWTSRTIGNANPRYLSASPEQESVPIKDTLYGYDFVKNTIIVCEGPTDVWRVGPGAVATFGLNYSSTQLDLIRRIPRRVVLFDKGVTAQKTAKKLCNELSFVPGETFSVQLESEDPGSATMDEIKALRERFEMGVES